ncbi:hypothetical protein KAJ61_02075 [Candidatus Parcubacteria bacterium]|nr:hypothetical protein [Candidatus Parcubacteria bacterium]
MEITHKNLNDLVLDINNPRFAELYTGSEKEEDLIEYLLFTESGEEIAKSITTVKEFYADRPLWVLKQGNKYLVKDGNRRCAAVKSLQTPVKYGLNLSKLNFEKLPVLIYKNKQDLEKRIIQEHTANLFKEWDRIAKALEVYKLYSSGNSIESMKEIDSNPSELVKLASFYYEAVKIKGDDLKKLLRRGRGKTGGKTIIFERLFKEREKCGYKFKKKPSYKIKVHDKDKFSKYVSALVEYLINNPNTTHKDIDDVNFKLSDLKDFGFDVYKKNLKSSTKTNIENTSQGTTSQTNINTPTLKRKSTKVKPHFERKQIPRPLTKLMNECYNLNEINFSNAKTALTRVSFECALKFVVENTVYNSKKISEYDFFKKAFCDKQGNKKKYTDFDILKTKFTELISNTGKRKAFSDFDLENPHQIIHNYNVGAVPATAQSLCDNLIPLLEFLLQEENDLLKSLDLNKL